MTPAVIRRQHHGCEDHTRCEWPRIVRVVPGEDYAALALCDFHRECLDEGVTRAAQLRLDYVTPREAIRLHPAAWRATR